MGDQFQWNGGGGCQPLGCGREGNEVNVRLQELPLKLLLHHVIQLVSGIKTKQHLACRLINFCQATQPFRNLSSSHTGF